MKNKLHYIIPFTISGMLGLIYQVIWSRFFYPVLGSTIYSVSIVISAFMLGISLGSFWAGKNIEKTKNCYKFYGIVLILLGISVLLFYPLYLLLKNNIFFLYNLSFKNSTLFLGIKFLVTFLLLFIPTFLMGTTYPFLVESWKNNFGDKKGISLLYGFNTFGGAIGSILTAFIFIRYLGLRSTLFLSAFCSILTGLIVVFISNLTSIAEKKQKTSGEISIKESKQPILKKYKILIFLTGFVTFVFEVAINRVYSPVFGSTGYSFAIILFTILIGIFIGSSIAPKLYEKKYALERLLFILVIYFILSIFFLQYLQTIILKIKIGLNLDINQFFFMELFIVFLIMIIPAIIFGITFPLIIYLASKEKDEGKVSGILYGINSIGSILGALSTSIILIPLFGVQRTLLLLPFLLIVFLFFTIRKRYQKIILIVFLLLIIIYPRWRPQNMVYNIFVLNKEISKTDNKILFYKDSLYENVAVTKFLKGNNLALRLDGKPDASYLDESTQKTQGLLPFFVKEKTNDVLVIGLGSGSTTSTCLQFPFVQSVETVEIEPAVVEAAHFFTKINKGTFSDTRSKIIVNDGRNYLLMHPEKKYDVVTSEPSNPWLSGSTLLFTKEYFELVKNHLKDDGIFCQWFPIYQVDLKDIKIVLKTLNSVFPYMSIWMLTSSEILALSSKKPLQHDWQLIEKRLKLIQSISGFKDIDEIKNIFSVEEFFYRNIANETTIKKFLMDESQLNLDNLPIIEFRTPKFVFENRENYIQQQLMVGNSPINIELKNDIIVDDAGYHFLPIGLVYRDNYVRTRGTILNIQKKNIKTIKYLIDFIGGIQYLTQFSTKTSNYKILSLRRYFSEKEIFKKQLQLLGINDKISEDFQNFKYFNKEKNQIVWYNGEKNFLWIIMKDTPFTKDDIDRFKIDENNK